MKRLVLPVLIATTCLVLIAIASQNRAINAQPQKPPIPAVAGPTTAEQLFSITPDLKFRSMGETVVPVSITAGVLPINLALGTVFTVTNNANITSVPITNPPATGAFTIYFTANGSGFTQTWPASFKWPFGSSGKPLLTTTNGAIDVITWTTTNSGTTWYGFVGGQAFQ